MARYLVKHRDNFILPLPLLMVTNSDIHMHDTSRKDSMFLEKHRDSFGNKYPTNTGALLYMSPMELKNRDK